MSAKDLLALFEVPGKTGLFVLGCLAPRITIYDQQVRALNLVDALVETKRLQGRDYVTVIGAGFGGLTAAAAAAAVGAHVRVVDDRTKPLEIQRGCDHRWLHPHIYDWPEETSSERKADVLFLSWMGNAADTVVDLLEAKWRKIVNFRSIQESYGHTVTGIRKSDDGDGKWIVETVPHSDAIANEPAKIVILAVGFGLERQQGARPIIRYWDRDNFHRTPLDVGDEVRYLVAGCGDGALIDTLRIRLQDFRHTTVLRDLKLTSKGLSETRAAIRTIETTARTEPDPAGYLKTSYERLRGTEEVDAALGRMSHPRVRVVLATRSANFYSLQSSALNRFLVARLVALKLVEHHAGELVDVTGQPPNVTAKLDPPIGCPIFQEVLTRIGVDSALAKHLGPVCDLCEPKLRPPRGAIDPTRVRREWSNLTSKSSAPSPLARASAPPTTKAYFATSTSVVQRLRASQSAHLDLSDADREPLKVRDREVDAYYFFVSRDQAEASARRSFAEAAGVVEVSITLAADVSDPGKPEANPMDKPTFRTSIETVEFIIVTDIRLVKFLAALALRSETTA